jgi:D-alanyl-D-alanine dipeptidase
MVSGPDDGASFGNASYHRPVPVPALLASTLAALLAAAPPAPGAAPLVDVALLIPRAVLDLRYATPDNFTGRALYPVARCLLQPEVAARLARAAAKLERRGYRLRLYDCYRPLSVQRAMWEAVPRVGFVADPKTGSLHNRGAAVDVGLSAQDGSELEMPTRFDSFERKARAWATAGIPPEARRHRDRLRAAMEAEGFAVNPLEWWHFDADGALEHPLLDLPLTAAGTP